MNNKNKSNLNKQKEKDKETKKSLKIIGLGLIKLDFYLNLTEDLIRLHNIDLSKINSPKDLKFLTEDNNLLDLIQISTTDTLINILLFINKANLLKSFVELISLNTLRFKPDEEHLQKIFSHVTEHNYLFSNEMNLVNIPNKITFAIKSGKNLLKYFEICTDYDPFAEEIKKEELKDLDYEIEKNKDQFVNKSNFVDVNSNFEVNNRKNNNNSFEKNKEEGKYIFVLFFRFRKNTK